MKSTRIDTRPATVNDAAGIARLISDLGYPCTTNQMRSRLSALANDAAYATFVACVDRTLAGMAGAFVGRIYEQDDPMGRIIALSVSNDFRRIGLGRQLVQAAENWIRSRGASIVLVNSGFDREDAHKFYERAGYSAKGASFIKQLPQ